MDFVHIQIFKSNKSILLVYVTDDSFQGFYPWNKDDLGISCF